MKKLLHIASLTLSLLLMAGFGTTGLAAAHVLKQDNGTSGVLHIPPEDNPQAGQPTELDIAFGNQANAFSLQDCVCKVMIKSNDQVLQTVQLEPYASGATLDSKATVRFPAAGVYDVIISGSAKDGRFHAFQLNYLVRVTGVANAPGTNNGASVIIISAGSLIILAMIAYSAVKAGQRYQRKPAKPPINKLRRKKP